MSKSESAPDELKWIEEPRQTNLRLPSEEFALMEQKTFSNTVLKKCRDNMFVPLGLIATTTCLTLGLVNMRKGDSAKQQIYMRGRIGFQAFTLAAMTIGVFLSARQGNRSS